MQKTMSTSSLNRFDDLLPPPNSIMKTNYTDDVSINDMQYSDNTDLSRCNRQMENMGFTMNDIHNQSLLQNYNQPMSQATYYDSNMYEPEDQEEMVCFLQFQLFSYYVYAPKKKFFRNFHFLLTTGLPLRHYFHYFHFFERYFS